MRSEQAVAVMACPVCKTGLSLSERQGVEIDYCPSCRGVWLDRGELNKIIERSAAPGGGGVATAPPPAPSVPQPPFAPPQQGYPPPAPGYPPQAPDYAVPPPGQWVPHAPQSGHWTPQPRPIGYGDDYKHGHGQRRRKSFLEELFD